MPASETRATASLPHPLDQAAAGPGRHCDRDRAVIGRLAPIWRSSLAVTRLSSTAMQVGARQYVGGARRQIGEIADRGGDDIEARGKRFVHREHRHGICPSTGGKRGAHSRSRAVAAQCWRLAALPVAARRCGRCPAKPPPGRDRQAGGGAGAADRRATPRSASRSSMPPTSLCSIPAASASGLTAYDTARAARRPCNAARIAEGNG